MVQFFNIYSSENTIVLELSGIYNIFLIVFGIIGLIFNLLETLINIKNKLFIQSLYNCTRLYNNLAGIILCKNNNIKKISNIFIFIALRHIFIGIVNFHVFRNNIQFYNNEICTIRGMIDMFTIHLFQISYVFQCLSFIISLVYPIQYMIKLNNGLIKIVILIIIIIWSFFPLTMLSIKIFTGYFPILCTNFDTWTSPFKIYYLNFTSFLIIFLFFVYVFTLWNIYGMKTKDEIKNSLNSFIAWIVIIFIVFWAIPNVIMIIFVYLDFENNIRAILLDIFYLSTLISVIIQFPFSLWKNKIIRKHFFEINFISYLIPSQTLSKFKNSL
ncbi:GPCR, rhodopsin-like, 7TM domain and 7TM GPCR, olfactory receptor/chemoreceptor Srsx family-containing protein [Strongyloides ratti]|uniref:GPCR, rhodopsin-like, 7TM domain and 7TM GPCR, olfactory receptor/chemoreceptor Srsx family-containing protein n=1 Tax=Strongyloides ratti TaxID=34506 RepID=A0A090KXU6_STRRB|nr:GPCR, rhodopsin-like, 7TM domain and 7TM GPCR, olfactory receptor/chemoreceptor Srsx family-containing protein [Strongyloides ratti]CEF62216.1 GPCR, rhodopsin-like, 7TM domain and 7TM GPCR, olfactory receptor/chemoreceptor Srsx family-containing protein [Strongyloides ratti]